MNEQNKEKLLKPLMNNELIAIAGGCRCYCNGWFGVRHYKGEMSRGDCVALCVLTLYVPTCD